MIMYKTLIGMIEEIIVECTPLNDFELTSLILCIKLITVFEVLDLLTQYKWSNFKLKSHIVFLLQNDLLVLLRCVSFIVTQLSKPFAVHVIFWGLTRQTIMWISFQMNNNPHESSFNPQESFFFCQIRNRSVVGR